MKSLKNFLVLVLASVLFSWGATAHAFTPVGSTWTVNCGDPARSGKLTLTLKVSYLDASGVKQNHAPIAASVDLTPQDTDETKKQKVQSALDAELSKDSNKVGGQPLAVTGGTGDVITITPAANNPAPGGFSGAQIDSVKTTDDKTGEDDIIAKPDGKKGLAQVHPQGELIGQTSDRGPSVFFVTTNLGTVSVQLTGSMSTLDLLKALKVGLLQQDSAAEVWVDSDLDTLFLKLGDGGEGIYSIGAGSTDEGLSAVCKVMIASQ